MDVSILTLQLPPHVGQSVDGDYEKTTGPIYLKFWQKFLLLSTTEIQK